MSAKHKEFIILRADGSTFESIAKTLKTSKSTLIKWSRLYQDEISDIQFESMIKIKEEFSNNKLNKYKTLLEQLEKVDNAILEKDLKEASLKELFLIKSNMNNQLERLEEKTVLKYSGLSSYNEFLNKNEALVIKLNEI